MPRDATGTGGAGLVGPRVTASARRSGATAVVTVTGELDRDTQEPLREALSEALERRPERIVVDCGGLTFCDSTGLNLLLTARLDALEAGTGWSWPRCVRRWTGRSASRESWPFSRCTTSCPRIWSKGSGRERGTEPGATAVGTAEVGTVAEGMSDPVRSRGQIRRLGLRSGESVIARCRDFCRVALADWDWPGSEGSGLTAEEREFAIEDVLLVVSEAVTNACLHAGGPTELVIRLAPTGSPIRVRRGISGSR